MRAILFVGAYATLDLFTEEINKELVGRGFETYVFDVKEYQKSFMGFAQFVQKPVDCVISYNNLGFNMELVPGKNIWDELDIPFVNILMDHPFHYKNALEGAPKTALVLCIDRKHVDYINRFFPGVRAGFMAHGGVYVELGKVWEDRQIDILYAGGLSSDLVDGLKPDCDKYTEFDANDLIKYATDKLIADNSLTTESVIEEYIVGKGVEIDDEKLSRIITDFRIIDSYAVSYYREKVIEALIESGHKVTVYGNGWGKRECINNPNLVYGGLVRPDEILELMKDAKIVLSTMTWFKDGSHDRVFHGMMAGAVCITDYSKYISEEIRDGENGFIFRLEDLDGLVEIADKILGGKYDHEKITANARENALSRHTFATRADTILEMLI